MTEPIADCFCEVCKETTRHYVRDFGVGKMIQCAECLNVPATLVQKEGMKVLV